MTEHTTEHGHDYGGIGAARNSIAQIRRNDEPPPHEGEQRRIHGDRLGMLTPFVLAVALLGVTLYYGLG